MLRDGSVEAGETFLMLVLFLGNSLLSFQDSFSVLVNLEGGNDTVGWVNGDLDLGSYKHIIRDLELPLVFSLVSFSM